MSKLTHFNQAGEAHMVDIADKAESNKPIEKHIVFSTLEIAFDREDMVLCPVRTYEFT
jgi:molybdenum cofactor biosynthesis enzyme